jgi:hypothetical protein
MKNAAMPEVVKNGSRQNAPGAIRGELARVCEHLFIPFSGTRWSFSTSS